MLNLFRLVSLTLLKDLKREWLKLMDNYRYRMLRIVCAGKIKPCEFCKDMAYEKDGKKIVHEGFCSKCGRPLDKKPGEECNSVVGYVDRGYRQQDKVNFICRNCNTIITV